MSGIDRAIFETQYMDAQRSRLRWRALRFWFGMSVLLLVISSPVLFLMLSLLTLDNEPRKPDPQRDFLTFTGWHLPSDAEVVFAENTHSGFHHDGHYTLVIRTSPETVANWIDTEGEDAWQQFPLPSELESRFRDVPYREGTLWRSISSEDDAEWWHRGSIVIVDPGTGRVWIHSWKG